MLFILAGGVSMVFGFGSGRKLIGIGIALVVINGVIVLVAYIAVPALAWLAWGLAILTVIGAAVVGITMFNRWRTGKRIIRRVQPELEQLKARLGNGDDEAARERLRVIHDQLHDVVPQRELTRWIPSSSLRPPPLPPSSSSPEAPTGSPGPSPEPP